MKKTLDVGVCPPHASYTLDLCPPYALVHATARHTRVHTNTSSIKAGDQLLGEMEKIEDTAKWCSIAFLTPL